jgi:hypothetical protein
MKPVSTLATFLFLAGTGYAQEVESASGAALRWLDKVSGVTTEIEMATGETAEMGGLQVTLSDCRFPTEDPTSNAYAHLTISDRANGQTIFAGWMIASSPALSALDDPRYDIWLKRCSNT